MTSPLRRVLPILPLLMAFGCDSGNGGSSAPPPAASGPPPSAASGGGVTKALKASGQGSSAAKDTTIIGTK